MQFINYNPERGKNLEENQAGLRINRLVTEYVFIPKEIQTCYAYKVSSVRATSDRTHDFEHQLVPRFKFNIDFISLASRLADCLNGY